MSPSPQLLRFPQVQARYPASKAWIYAQIKLGHFPKPIKVGPRAVAWIESEIDALIASKVSESRGGVQTREAQTA